MKFNFVLILSLFFGLGCNKSGTEQAQNSPESSDAESSIDITLTLEWMTHGLDHVESVLYDSERNVIYATNGKEKLEGADGYISRISSFGEILELMWVKGLIRPTGMALSNNKLYVADVNALLIIDLESGEILEQIKEPVKQSGLNDVAISQEGEVFVTASLIHAVLKLSDGKLEVWAKDDDKLKYANGILAEDDKLLIGGEVLNSIDYSSKIVSGISLDPPVGDFDGITRYGTKGYLITTVEKSAMWFLDDQHRMKQLMSSNEYAADLEYIPELKMVIVARGNSQRNRFFIAAYSLK